jgi:hypothetical protein
MLKTLELLQDDLIKSYTILDFKSGDSFYFIKIRTVLVDDSELHIKEFFSIESLLYSYHWQDEMGIIRIRWDNAPHHPQLRTYPHHKHNPDVNESKEVSLEDVLMEIREMMQK